MKFKIGDTIPYLPKDYWDAIEHLPDNAMIIMASPSATTGAYAFLKKGVLVKVIDKADLATELPPIGQSDAIVANTIDIDGELKSWMETAKTKIAH